MSDRPVHVSTEVVPYTVSIHDGQHRWVGDTQPANGGAERGAAGTDISREIVLEGALDDVQRARLMEVADKCPIHRLLTGEVRIASRLQAATDAGDPAIGV